MKKKAVLEVPGVFRRSFRPVYRNSIRPRVCKSHPDSGFHQISQVGGVRAAADGRNH